MSRPSARFLLFAMTIAAACGAPPPTSPIILSIVGTNDVHGAMLDGDGQGGLALFGGYLKNLRAARARDRGGVLLVDAGDMWQGTLESNLSEGAVMVEAYGALGYQAVTIGNHEFDYGPAGEHATPTEPGDDPRGALRQRAAAARFPFLAANIVEIESARPVDWQNVRPSTSIDVAGVRVGLIGVTTVETLEDTIAANLRGLTIRALAPTVESEARGLRAAGATVVVVLAHAGGRCQRYTGAEAADTCGANDEIVQVARALPSGLVDVIVAGHTHAPMANEINGVAVIESFARGRAFGRVDLAIDPATRRPTTRTIHPPENICAYARPDGQCVPATGAAAEIRERYEGAVVERDARVAAIVAGAAERVAEIKARPLEVIADTAFPTRGEIESPLGNLVADALLAGADGAQIAINNTDGGLRAELPAGPVTFGRIYEVFPFDNLLVTFPITGAQLKQVLAGQMQGGAQILGLAGFRAVARCSRGRADVALTRASGAPIGDAETLTLATTDYLATTPLFATVPAARTPRVDRRLARDLIVDWLRARGGRLDAASFINEHAPRYPARSTLPMKCGASSAPIEAIGLSGGGEAAVALLLAVLPDPERGVEMLRLGAAVELGVGIEDEAARDDVAVDGRMGPDVDDVGGDELAGDAAEHGDVAGDDVAVDAGRRLDDHGALFAPDRPLDVALEREVFPGVEFTLDRKRLAYRRHYASIVSENRARRSPRGLIHVTFAGSASRSSGGCTRTNQGARRGACRAGFAATGHPRSRRALPVAARRSG
ncbi:MAG TPA: bifunctional UDP-sugar hydrolase/5'-nucleotidase [Vicinamibacterales bacterium]|nr:bifunctional UDP-sugar hydrolase/5'-nucleotidase [Vicinamibacterales bacterium]